jgi:exopolysaccharide biosynthesis polyprenyl glycosylphosphotransferase
LSLLSNRGRSARRRAAAAAASAGGPAEDDRLAIPAQRRAEPEPTVVPAEVAYRAEANRIRKMRFGAHERRYITQLQAVDAAAGGLAGLVALQLSLDLAPRGLFVVLSVLFPLIWVLCVALNRAYEPRFLYVGTEEFRRVAQAAFAVAVAGALVSYAMKLELSRGYLLTVVTVVFTFTVAFRLMLRSLLRMRRISGAGWMRRVVVAGHDDAVRDVVSELRRSRSHGHEVVGICLMDRHASAPYDVPVTVGADRIAEAATNARADTVVVLPCHHLAPADLRRLGWELERAETQMLVAPGLLDVAHRRATVAPVGALALLHVDHAELYGLRRIVKEAFDRTAAAVALLVLLPVLACLTLAVRFDSRGPAIFRQERVGRDDRRFMLLKFRTMVVDAEARRQEVEHQNEGAGLLFKIRDDPRVTRLGRFLRRYSLDELPQLVNVLLGHMSLVGPRPPLPSEVDGYAGDVRRRLAVKPGITGLWQVSGRSDLSWDESVRLDLRYVENWSLALDVSILWRTLRAVLATDGAY